MMPKFCFTVVVSGWTNTPFVSIEIRIVCHCRNTHNVFYIHFIIISDESYITPRWYYSLYGSVSVMLSTDGMQAFSLHAHAATESVYSIINNNKHITQSAGAILLTYGQKVRQII